MPSRRCQALQPISPHQSDATENIWGTSACIRILPAEPFRHEMDGGRYRRRRRSYLPPEPIFPPCVMYTAGILFIVALVAVIWDAVGATEDFLYRDHDDTEPIDDWGKGGPAYPPYLNSSAHGAQLVEFYAPWCPHCQHYKPHYIQLARDVQATEEGKNVQFRAISCTVHKDICKQEGIRGYPTVKLYRAGNSTGSIPGRGGKNFKVDEVLSELGIARRGGSGSASGKPVKKAKEPTAAEIAAKSHIRTHAELFSDAAVSFNFALHHSIYTLHGPLDTDAKNALRKWLALLHQTLPLEMKATHKQIDALQMNFDEIASSEDALLKTIDGVKLDSNSWSLSCTKGDHHKGYTCGLWSMFHIISVGLVEHNAKQEEGDDFNRIATMNAANSLRDYISHFFGCEECRKNFVGSYDNCDFGRCERLSNDPGDSVETWREFALWLFEVHNAVNVRLQREKAQREGKPKPTAEDRWQAKWPSAKACPRCWTGDDSWNKDAVYEYLRSEYWPTGETSNTDKNVGAGRGKYLRKRIERIERFAMTHEAEFVDASMALASNGIVMPLAVVAIIGSFCYLLKQHRDKNQYGRGKKFDGGGKRAARSPYRSSSRGKPRSAGVL